MKIKIKDIYYNKIFIIICLVSIILNSGHALITIIPQLRYLTLIFSVMFFIPIFITYDKKKLNIYLVAYLMLVSMCILTLIFSGIDNLTYYIIFISTITFAFGITLIYDFKDVVNIFLKIMVFISIISLIGYFLVNNTTLLNMLPIYNNINNVEYRIGLVFNYITIIPKRNCGMFWEPGLFATYLILALIFELIFKEEKISKFRVILFTLCILTTNSSAGYALLAFIFIIIFLNKNKNEINNKLYYISYIILFVAGILVIFNYSKIIESTEFHSNEVFAKLISANIIESTRYRAINHNLSMFMKNPIFGNGIVKSLETVKYVSDTSTSTFMLNIFGILGIQYSIYIIYGVLKITKKTIYNKVILLVILLAIINKEPHEGIVFTWCILFYLLKESTVKKKGIEING